MNECDFKISADLTASCEKPSVAGLKNHGYLFNYDDIKWDEVEYAADNNNVITDLPLVDGARAYAVYMPGKTPFTGTQKAFSEGTYRNHFEKTVSLVILDNGAEVSNKVIDQLANGKFVAILENEYQGTDKKNTFEVFGSEQGLFASEMTDDKYSEDTDGGWAVSLVETKAPSSGIYLFNGTVGATRELLESMVSGN